MILQPAYTDFGSTVDHLQRQTLVSAASTIFESVKLQKIRRSPTGRAWALRQHPEISLEEHAGLLPASPAPLLETEVASLRSLGPLERHVAQAPGGPALLPLADVPPPELPPGGAAQQVRVSSWCRVGT